MVPESARRVFESMIGRPEPAFDLARTALLVAAEADPELDVEREMRTLEAWAEEFRSRVRPEWNNLQKLARLRAFVFEELGFKGDARDYYSPRNSLLHEVVRSRKGIPLTLAIVFMELGWRAGMPLEAVGFPGHFLMRLAGEPADLLLDPFEHACSVHEEDCRRMLLEISGGKLEYDRRLTASIGKRDTIVRLLQNLKVAYLREEDDAGALGAVERLLLLRPGDAGETRDRGLLLFRLHRYGRALECLRTYLAKEPAATDRERIEGHIAALRELLAELN